MMKANGTEQLDGVRNVQFVDLFGVFRKPRRRTTALIVVKHGTSLVATLLGRFSLFEVRA